MTFKIALGLLGGLALFIYGVNLLSNAAKAIIGPKLRSFVNIVVKHRAAGLLVGIIITFLLQSSSASTVLFVSFVQSGVIAFKDTIAMILGAMIGTTLTVQIISFNVADYAFIPIIFGVALFIATKYQYTRQYANMFIGLGLIFFGMAIMKDAVVPLRESEVFVSWFTKTIGVPWFSFFIALVFTALVQASAATMALLFTFSSSGLLGSNPEMVITAALPFVFGANVGTTVTALLASIGTNRAALRCSVAHSLIKTTGAVACMFCVPSLANLAVFFTTSDSYVRLIANSHTIFNLINVIVFLPFTSLLAKLFQKMIPDKDLELFFPFLNNIDLENFDLDQEYSKSCLALSKCVNMIVATILNVNHLLRKPSWKGLEDLKLNDRKIDGAFNEIELHAKLIFQFSDNEKNVVRVTGIIERIGDHYAKGIRSSLEKMYGASLSFSEEQLDNLYSINLSISDLLSELAAAYLKNRKLRFSTANNLTDLKSLLSALREKHIKSIKNQSEILIYNCYSDILDEIESALNKINKLKY